MDIYNLEQREAQLYSIDTESKARSFDLILKTKALLPQQKAANRVIELINSGDCLVDIGAGSGLVTLHIAGKLPDIEIFGLEENQYLYSLAKQNLNFALWCGTQLDVEFDKVEFSNIPFEDNTFDLVYSYNSLHRWSNPVKTLNECIRICKHGGIIHIEDFNRLSDEESIAFVLQFIDEGADEFLSSIRAGYSQEELIELLKNTKASDYSINADAISLIISFKK